jgi:hypothetical protein
MYGQCPAISRAGLSIIHSGTMHALYLTVFWFPSMCTSEKTVKKTVRLSG